ncbi:MAG: hypothetical protein ACLFRZ_09440 [Rhodosalinus sp.]
MRYALIAMLLAATPAAAVTPTECAQEVREVMKAQARFMDHRFRMMTEIGGSLPQHDETLEIAGDTILRHFNAYQEYMDDFCAAVEREQGP